MTSLALALLLAAEVTVSGLTGLSEDAAKARLGAPDIARREANGALWTYRKTDCVLLVYLTAKPGEALHVSGVSAGPRRAGEAAPTTEACLAQPKG